MQIWSVDCLMRILQILSLENIRNTCTQTCKATPVVNVLAMNENCIRFPFAT